MPTQLSRGLLSPSVLDQWPRTAPSHPAPTKEARKGMGKEEEEEEEEPEEEART